MLQKSHDDAMASAPSALTNGVALLQDPARNKGTAFTEAERDALHLRGLLPPHVSSQEQQLGRVLENFRRKSSDLEKYINLRALHDRNETLFFRLLMDHPDEVMPIV
jgi:malate dehydrogenase (oxaloacetate-decarboxylating)(NADP+)